MELHLLSSNSDFNRIKKVWLDLSLSYPTSYFLSWGWVEHWIESLPESIKPKLALISENGQPIMAFFLKARKLIRHGWLPVKSIFFNSTGIFKYDSLRIEYNHVLGMDPNKFSLAEILELLPQPWEEIVIPGIDRNIVLRNDEANPYNIFIYEEYPAPYVDLTKVRDCQYNYLSLLSCNTRAQIKRSYRLYENQHREVTIQQADNLIDALQLYEELVHLKCRRYELQQKKCSLSIGYLYNFHKGLISKRFSSGEIQLLSIASGGDNIGYLYNFVYDNRVYFYQSGFHFNSDNRFKPGLVSQLEAILYNARLGHTTYEFLASDERYKKSLSTDYNHLVWIVIQKPMCKFKLERQFTRLTNLMFS